MTTSGTGLGYEPISQLDWNAATYIGDGVYAHHDGYQVWLLTDRSDPFAPPLDRTAFHVIALPPSVFAASRRLRRTGHASGIP